MKNIIPLLIFLSIIITAQDSTKYSFEHHNIVFPIDNQGILADVRINENSGIRFKDVRVIYSSGFLLSGFANDTLWLNGVASFSRIEDYLPGSYKNSENDNLANIYILKKSDTPFGESWQNWRNAVKLGADFYDGDRDGVYNPVDKNNNGKWDLGEDRPDLIGEQTAWCVYKDSRSSESRNFNFQKPVGIEIQQTIFATSLNESFKNTIFVRYRIENTGLVADLLDSVYFTIFADPDLGNFQDDLVGCDTLINGGFVYQTEQDEQFEENTPSVIMYYVQGPVSYIPNVTFLDNNSNGIFDTLDSPITSAYNINGRVLGSEKYDGGTNLSMSSFSGFPNLIMGEPLGRLEYRSKMKGYNIFDPCEWDLGIILNEDCSNISQRYMYSGDPVSLNGWIDYQETDQRIMINTGPFNLLKQKPIDIVFAYSIGEGVHPLQSLKIAKINARNVQFYFRNNAFESFDEKLSIPDFGEPIIKFNLEQNYPNPFNPTTKITYSIPFRDNPQNVTLKVYNLLGEVVITLVDEIKTTGNYSVNFSAANLTTGVYIYSLSNGEFRESKKLMVLK